MNIKYLSVHTLSLFLAFVSLNYYILLVNGSSSLNEDETTKEFLDSHNNTKSSQESYMSSQKKLDCLKNIDNSRTDISLECFNKTTDEIDKSDSNKMYSDSLDFSDRPDFPDFPDKSDASDIKTTWALYLTFEKNPGFIDMIFYVFIIQIFALYSYSFSLMGQWQNKNSWVKKIVHHSIETSPYLGILGTIYSFATVASNSDTEKITVLFKQGFESAILTTIIGGSIFIYAITLDYIVSDEK